jgi:hypothetical protein
LGAPEGAALVDVKEGSKLLRVDDDVPALDGLVEAVVIGCGFTPFSHFLPDLDSEGVGVTVSPRGMKR